MMMMMIRPIAETRHNTKNFTLQYLKKNAAVISCAPFYVFLREATISGVQLIAVRGVSSR
jgi:hypothetical protein